MSSLARSGPQPSQHIYLGARFPGLNLAKSVGKKTGFVNVFLRQVSSLKYILVRGFFFEAGIPTILLLETFLFSHRFMIQSRIALVLHRLTQESELTPCQFFFPCYSSERCQDFDMQIIFTFCRVVVKVLRHHLHFFSQHGISPISIWIHVFKGHNHSNVTLLGSTLPSKYKVPRLFIWVEVSRT